MTRRLSELGREGAVGQVAYMTSLGLARLNPTETGSDTIGTATAALVLMAQLEPTDVAVAVAAARYVCALYELRDPLLAAVDSAVEAIGDAMEATDRTAAVSQMFSELSTDDRTIVTRRLLELDATPDEARRVVRRDLLPPGNTEL